MTKRNFKKSGKNGKEKRFNEYALEIVEKGEMLGDSFIGIMAISAINTKGVGIATYALAKAWAALRSVAEEMDVEVDSLFEGTTSLFINEFREDIRNINETGEK